MAARSVGLILLLVLGSGWFRASIAETRQWTFEVADPERAVSIHIEMPYLEIEVIGTDEHQVFFELETEGELAAVIAPSASGNVVELVARQNSSPAKVQVRTPRQSHLELFSSNGAPILVKDVEGQLEITNSNAAVILENVRGGATVSTSNGPITASFATVDETDLSFITSNARVELTLPASFAAQVLLETDGGIQSDFQIETAPPSAVHRTGPVVAGQVGRSERLLRVRTDNARIILRRIGEP